MVVALHVEGGAPAGSGDVLNVITGGAGYQFALTGVSGEGVLTVDGTAPTTFPGIEQIHVDGSPVTLETCKRKKLPSLNGRMFDQFVCEKG